MTHPAAARVGQLSVEAAAREVDETTELLIAVLRRPGNRRRQLAFLGIEHEETGGALIECVLTPPLPAREARARLQGSTADSSPVPVQAIDAAELTRHATTAAHRARRIGIALGSEAGLILPIVSRALTGEPAGLPRLETLAPWEEDDDSLIPECDDQAGPIVELTPDARAPDRRPGGPGAGPSRKDKRKAQRVARKRGRRS